MNRGDSGLLVYPPVVIAHIARDLTDIYAPRAEGKDLIEIHYSAQLNGHPHMGTMTSLATAFAAGHYLSEAYGIPAMLRFEALENAPAVQRKVGGFAYNKTYWDVYEGSRPRAEVFMDSFRRLLEYFSQNSGVAYSVLYYKEFQALPFVRQMLLEILDRQDEFIPFIAPTERYLRIRFPCPVCSFAEKTAKKTRVVERWSGAKFSKSVYIAKGTYSDLPLELVDFEAFEMAFGVAGLAKVWHEVLSWVSDPKKLFQNYSVEYLRRVFLV